MWKDQKCSGANQKATMALMVVIGAQPLGHTLIAYTYSQRKRDWAARTLIGLAALAFTASYVNAIRPFADRLCSLPGTDAARHLVWAWIAPVEDAGRVGFLATLVLPFVLMSPGRHAAVYIAYTSAIWGIAMFWWVHQAAFESLWCWFAVIGSALPFLLNLELRSGAWGKAAQD